MSDNKKIGFDILENSNINEITEIGADNMIIDKSARDRMLKITKQKYREERKNMLKEQRNDNISEEDAVTGVEKYSRRRVTRIVYTALCSAAAIALVAGSIIMLSRKSAVTPHLPDPIDQVSTTTVTGTTTVTTTGTGTSAAKTGTTISSETSNTETSGTSSVQTTAASGNSENNVTVEKEDVRTFDTKNFSRELTMKFPSVDPSQATQDILEAAKDRALDYMMNVKSPRMYDTEQYSYGTDEMRNIKYRFVDVNGDGVPELTVTFDNMISTETAMLIFDGNDYVPAKFNGHTWEGTPVEAYVYASMVMVCKEENILYIASKHGYENISIIKFEEDNSLTPIYESNYTAVYKNGKRVANGFSDFENSPGLPVIDQYNWTELTADTFYAEANETAVKGEQERQKIMEEAERIANSENYE